MSNEQRQYWQKTLTDLIATNNALNDFVKLTAVMRQFAVRAARELSQNGKDIVDLHGNVLIPFDSVADKEAYLTNMSTNAVWGSVDLMHVVSSVLGWRLNVHYFESGTRAAVHSQKLQTTDREDAPVINIMNRSGKFFDFALRHNGNLQKQPNLHDGNCAFGALAQAVRVTMGLKPALSLTSSIAQSPVVTLNAAKPTRLAEQSVESDISEQISVVKQDALSIEQRTQRAQLLLNGAQLTANALVAMMKSLGELAKAHHGDSDTYLLGHADDLHHRVEIGDNASGIIQDAKHCLATRAGVDQDVYDALETALKNAVTKPAALAHQPTLWKKPCSTEVKTPASEDMAPVQASR